jgi:hypothetical protein
MVKALYLCHGTGSDLAEFFGHLFRLLGCPINLLQGLLELAGLIPDNSVSLGAPLLQLLSYIPDHLLAEGFVILLFLLSKSLFHALCHTTILFLVFVGISVA